MRTGRGSAGNGGFDFDPDSLVVECRGLSRVYEAAQPVVAVDACDLVIRRGEFVSIMGPSGSGKSTLLNCLGLVDRPTAGSYRLGSWETTRLTGRQRASIRGMLVGFVFQAYHLLAGRDVAENIAMGLLYRRVARRERLRRAAETAAQVGLAPRLSTPVENLSGGERQRVAIGRAIVGDPVLVLADEPTGNLDSQNSDLILDLLQQLNDRGHTIVVVTHDPTVARRARRHLSLIDGRLAETA
ncbi:MAG: ABC transporter ATP-binding protein [Acidimicrobiia bacterium]